MKYCCVERGRAGRDEPQPYILYMYWLLHRKIWGQRIARPVRRSRRMNTSPVSYLSMHPDCRRQGFSDDCNPSDNAPRRDVWQVWCGFQPARGSQTPSSPHGLGGHPAWAGGCGVASPNRLPPTPWGHLHMSSPPDNAPRRDVWKMGCGFQPARGSQTPSSPHGLGSHQAWAGGCGVASPNRLPPTPV